MEKDRIYSSLSLLCFNLFIASLIIIVCSYFSILDSEIINQKIIFWTGIFFCALSIFFREKSGEGLFSRAVDNLSD